MPKKILVYPTPDTLLEQARKAREEGIASMEPHVFEMLAQAYAEWFDIKEMLSRHGIAREWSDRSRALSVACLIGSHLAFQALIERLPEIGSLNPDFEHLERILGKICEAVRVAQGTPDRLYEANARIDEWTAWARDLLGDDGKNLRDEALRDAITVAFGRR